MLRNPALVPASAMFRREVYEATGGFDEGLRTAEDIDFHLRVALRFPIAVIDEPLTRAMRGHQGLSALSRTTRDYMAAVERFLDANAQAVAPRDRDAALFWACSRNARAVLWEGSFGDAVALATRALVRVRRAREARELTRLALTMARNAGVRVRRKLRRPPTPT